MKSKCLLILLVFSVLIPICTAELDIVISSYDPFSGLAKLKVANSDNIGYSEIKLAVDNGLAVQVADYLAPENCFSIPQTIQPGEHTILLTTKEGKSVAMAAPSAHPADMTPMMEPKLRVPNKSPIRAVITVPEPPHMKPKHSAKTYSIHNWSAHISQTRVPN